MRAELRLRAGTLSVLIDGRWWLPIVSEVSTQEGLQWSSPDGWAVNDDANGWFARSDSLRLECRAECQASGLSIRYTIRNEGPLAIRLTGVAHTFSARKFPDQIIGEFLNILRTGVIITRFAVQMSREP